MFALTFVAIAQCCTIPVFRYALEHWPPETLVLHIVGSSADIHSQKELIEKLERLHKSANLKLSIRNETTIDAAKIDLILREGMRLSNQSSTDNPVWMFLENTRNAANGPSLLWNGPFTDANVVGIFDSPARQRIAQALADDTAIYWVFLDSKDPERNEAAFDKLESELLRLETVIQLPVIDPTELRDQKSITALPIRFAALRIAHASSSEQFFRSMLLATEDDLKAEYEDGSPIAFPIFGRGRVLYALVGDGISPKNIYEACDYLCSACQCTVKQENPGVDLLFSFDWDRHVKITSHRNDGRGANQPGSSPAEDLMNPLPIPLGATRKQMDMASEIVTRPPASVDGSKTWIPFAFCIAFLLLLFAFYRSAFGKDNAN